MSGLNWEKANRQEKVWRADRDAPPKRKKSPLIFRLDYPTDCARCGRHMARNTPARRSGTDGYKHAQGCPTSGKRNSAKQKRKPNKRKSKSFELRTATPCATCRVEIPRGAQAVRNKGGHVVHHRGCPKKNR